MTAHGPGQTAQPWTLVLFDFQAGRQQFLDAVQRTADGEAVFTAGLAGLVLGEYRKLATSKNDKPQLTVRETEVLRLLAKGLSYQAVADELAVSIRTVQNHVQNTLGKLPLRNRSALVRYAFQHGLDRVFLLMPADVRSAILCA